MQARVEIHFESIEVTRQEVLGEPGDHLDAVVRFAFRYPDGRIDTNCTAAVWHALKTANDDIVHVTLPAAYQCPVYGPGLERAIEAYYRQRVGRDGTLIRIGPHGASSLILGIPRESIASAWFDIEPASAA